MEETLTGASEDGRESMHPSGGIRRSEIERLYAESLPKVVAFSTRILGDAEAGRDVAQDAFAAALASAASFRGEASPLTWILSIARKLCLKRLRGRRERSFGDIGTLIDAYSEAPSDERSGSEVAFYVEEVKEGCLAGLLLCLPFAQRCAFVLRLLVDLPLSVTARAMGRSENSVRILLSRARSSLRSFLCSNCSLLTPGARCSCANMIEFSLRRDLVRAYRPSMGTDEIRAELRRFADEVELYRSLPDPAEAIAAVVAGGAYGILKKE